MRRCVRHALTVLLLTLAVTASASAQITAAEIAETGFFGSNVSSKLQEMLPSFDVARDKDNPLKLELPFGTLYGFFHRGDPILVLRGTGAIDFGDAVALPADQLVLNDFVWIYSKKNITLQSSDFPGALTAQLQKFWLLPSITLLEKGNVLRAEPTGSVLDAVRGFLMLDNLSGTTIVAFAKSKTIKTTQVMLHGTITNPFGMGMTLTNPLISYTKKTTSPGTTMGLASEVSIKSKTYDFMAEGDVKLRKPEIFVLKTDRMNPQDVVNVVGAMSRPLFALTAGAMPPWNLGGIPSFELRPPRTASSNFPAEDQSKVVVYAAVADKPEWGIKGPALKIRGNLAIETKPKQDIAVVELVADASSLYAAFGLPSFTLPGSTLTFGTATAALTARTGATRMGITAESGSDCFKQKFSFSVDQTGVPQFDVNANQQLKGLTPEGFMGNFKACARDGAKLAQWTLAAGEQLLGFTRDQLVTAAAPIFGVDNTALAAKALSYPVDLVASSLGKVGSNAQMVLRAGERAFGVEQLGSFGKAAGYSIESIFAYHRNAANMGPMPRLDFKSQADINRFMNWAGDYGRGLANAGKFAGQLFPRDDMLNAGRRVFDEIGLGGAAYLGRIAGYSANDVAQYFKAQGVAKDAIAKILQGGGYAKDQTVNAIVAVYGGSRDAAEKLWDSVSAPVGDALKEGCKAALGWTKIC